MASLMLNNQDASGSGKRNNDDLNDEELDLTWGGKRKRYLYNYTLQSPVNHDYDSDQTESILSMQSKPTMEVLSEADLSSNECCGYQCNCNQTEFDVRSLSDSSHNFDNSDNSSDSSVIESYKVPMLPSCNTLLSNDDNDDDNDETDNYQVIVQKKNLPPPACFKLCLQCRGENPNPYYQYCFTCYQLRKEYFIDKPKPRKKKPVNQSQKHNQTSQRSLNGDSLDKNNLLKNIDGLKNTMNNKMPKHMQNVCNICFIMPKNSVFNHGKIGHVFCCYPCAKNLLKKTKKCPICNVNVQYITKMIVV